MNLRTLFMIVAVVGGLFGLGNLIAPIQMSEPYGVTLNETTTGLARLLGAALLTFAVIAWLARDAAPSEARRAIVLGFFVGDLVGALVALQGVLSGQVGALGWTTVAIYAFFALGFGYFAFMKRTALAT